VAVRVKFLYLFFQDDPKQSLVSWYQSFGS
ncbi:hypothetical protein A2U01_0068222, partial [Trifolium medium]|nr:hypothetical protein [Trifolium medium]